MFTHLVQGADLSCFSPSLSWNIDTLSRTGESDLMVTCGQVWIPNTEQCRNPERGHRSETSEMLPFIHRHFSERDLAKYGAVLDTQLGLHNKC